MSHCFSSFWRRNLVSIIIGLDTVDVDSPNNIYVSKKGNYPIVGIYLSNDK